MIIIGYCLLNIKKLLAEGFMIPTGTMVLLLDLYLNHNKLEEAKEIFKQLNTTNSEFILDRYKVIKMAEEIVKTDGVQSKFVITLFKSY